jgi:hypothetical protein
MRNPANAIGADLRILFVEDEPMDVLGEQHALKRFPARARRVPQGRCAMASPFH